MSTKIYDGLCLRDNSADLYDLVPKIAEAIQSTYKKLAVELVSNELSLYLDSKKFREEANSQDSVFFKAEKAWKDQQYRFGSRHTLNDPLRFSIVFGKSSQGNILALPFYGEPAYGKTLKKLKLFKPYPYWDSSDRPRNITAAKWQERREEWESIENKEGTYASLPHWTLAKSTEPWMHVLLSRSSLNLNKHRSQETRLRTFLIESLTKSVIDELEPQENKPSFYYSVVVKSSAVVDDFLKTDEASQVALPEPLTSGIDVTFSDLPPLYEPNPDLVKKLRLSYDKRNN